MQLYERHQNMIYQINESLERTDVSAEELEQWLDDNAQNESVPDWLWDFVHAVAENAE